MSDRSLQVQQDCIQQAKNALIGLGLTQKELAEARLQLGRSTVSNFLRGKPVAKENFVKICETLKLDWQEVSGLINPDTKDLIVRFRKQVKADIEEYCGTMRILDMSQPIALGKIYTQVNILEKVSAAKRKDIGELMSICDIAEFDRFNFGAVKETKIKGQTAVTNHKTLFILGKPGAGKTTFLKHLAIQCNRGKFLGGLVPFFVTLKDFAEDKEQSNLLAYLHQTYLEAEQKNQLIEILRQGKALVLLDGLDEVLEAESKAVIKQIEQLTNKYSQNQYVLTCRIAAKEYTFEKFTEVEIADFDWQQITIFAHNWFRQKPTKPEKFLDRLEKDQPIKELVSNPLLLTLLCISFEELGDFPDNRKELYQEGLNALLRKWDASRGIQRDRVYQPLSIAKKEDLLSNIAWKTFAPGNYFFKAEQAQRYIGEYIRNLPEASLDDEALQGDSGVVLRNIEAQHGLLVARAKNIYSFSHLTFQEYFTAREIILVRQSSDEALQELVSHLFDKRWREVFLLAVAMSPNAERLVLLMKQRIDSLLAEAPFQILLKWLQEKVNQTPIKLSSEEAKAIQKGYKYYASNHQTLARIYYLGLELNLHLYLNLDLDLYLYLYQNLNLAQKQVPQLYDALLKLKQRLPDEESTNDEETIAWWKANGKDWSNDFRAAMVEHRNIGHDWQFNEEQKELLEKYYVANQLLTQCLHQDCYVSPEVRQEIEETLLLPIAEIKKRKKQG